MPRQAVLSIQLFSLPKFSSVWVTTGKEAEEEEPSAFVAVTVIVAVPSFVPALTRPLSIIATSVSELLYERVMPSFAKSVTSLSFLIATLCPA